MVNTLNKKFLRFPWELSVFFIEKTEKNSTNTPGISTISWQSDVQFRSYRGSCKATLWFSKEWIKKSFKCWSNIPFKWERILLKQSSGFISVIRTLRHGNQHSLTGMPNLKRSRLGDRLNSAVVPEKITKVNKIVFGDRKLQFCLSTILRKVKPLTATIIWH